jgi:hypothetical protein
MHELLGALRAALTSRRLVTSRPVLSAIAASVVVVTLAAIVWDYRHRRETPSPGGLAEKEITLDVSATAVDWTDSSRVLATLAAHVRCLVALPDQHTVRVVAGLPPRAEDIDTQTGARRPSPLVPAAYAEGCPDLAPNGRDLIFQGFDQEGRPSILLSSSPDGSDARAVVASADPSMDSEPHWFAGGQAFVFDMDVRRLGVFEPGRGRARAVPMAPGADDWAVWRAVSGNRIVLAREDRENAAHLEVFAWPGFLPPERLFLGRQCFGEHYRVTHDFVLTCTSDGDLLQIDLPGRRILGRGMIRNQVITYSAEVAHGLAFISARSASDAWTRTPSGAVRRLTTDGKTREIASCGLRGFLISREERDAWRIVRLDREGRVTATSPESSANGPACSTTTADRWYAVIRHDPHIQRCDDARCWRVFSGQARRLALSPDERRLAFVASDSAGLVVRWIGADGGPVHFVSESEGTCHPAWSSNHTLWVSRRRKGKFVWTEIDVDSGQMTGRTAPGGKSCAEGYVPDPLAPTTTDSWLVFDDTSEVRLLAGNSVVRSRATLSPPQPTPVGDLEPDGQHSR